MGYTTEFRGSLTIEPPLSAEEVHFLKRFSDTRRCQRKEGPYYVAPERGPDVSFDQSIGQDFENVIAPNTPPTGQPGLWCQWVPSEDGKTIGWNGGEKFYDSFEWMQYLIDHFIGSAPLAKGVKGFRFLKPHTLNGEIEAQGEEMEDRWKLICKKNKLTRRRLP